MKTNVLRGIYVIVDMRIPDDIENHGDRRIGYKWEGNKIISLGLKQTSSFQRPIFCKEDFERNVDTQDRFRIIPYNHFKWKYYLRVMEEGTGKG